MIKTRLFVALMFALLLAVPTLAQDAPADAVNLIDSCVTEYDTTVDYFPDKAEITDAQNFTVEYFNNYKVVTVQGSMETYQFVLVQCGTPAPDSADFPEGTQFIEVPAAGIVSLSTTFLPGIAQLGLAENVVGLDSLLYTSTPEIVERIEAGEIVEVSPNFELNTEIVLSLEPSLVMTDDFDPARITTLTDADVFTAVNTDYLESKPLGRAEWLKFTALFYNREAEAESLYADIVTAYEDAKALAASVPQDARPVVLVNTFSSFSDAWSVPGAQTYLGALIADAGGVVALAEEAPEGSALVSFESVYGAALDADIWLLNTYAVGSLDDLAALDSRYVDFAAYASGNVWNNDADSNANGGNNYYELGVTSPHLVLQDYVAMFHPQLLPDHVFRFHRQLTAGE